MKAVAPPGRDVLVDACRPADLGHEQIEGAVAVQIAAAQAAVDATGPAQNGVRVADGPEVSLAIAGKQLVGLGIRRPRIALGIVPPGEALPAERELALRFSVSRDTVREAIKSWAHYASKAGVPAKQTAEIQALLLPLG